MWDYILFGLFSIACEIIGTVGGFGSSIFFVPLASFFMPRQLVLGLTSILHVFSNTSKIILFWKYIDRRLLLLFGIASLLLTIVGAWLTGRVKFEWAEWALGIFLVGFSLFFLAFPRIVFPRNKLNAIAGGSIAGFAAGFLGTGGAIRGMSMSAFDLSKDVFVGTSAAIDFGVDISRMFIYAGYGFMESANWVYILILFISSWVGTWIGKNILEQISQNVFRKLTLLLILLVGIATVLNAAGVWAI